MGEPRLTSWRRTATEDSPSSSASFHIRRESSGLSPDNSGLPPLPARRPSAVGESRVPRREGRIKIPSTRTPPFGTSTAASELGGFKFAVLHGEKMVYKNYTSKIMFGGRS